MSKKPIESQKGAILAAAVTLARKQGLQKFSRIEVAKLSGVKGVGESTVSYHFGTMTALRIEVVKVAVAEEIVSILADARASRETYGVSMSPALKEKVANYIAK